MADILASANTPAKGSLLHMQVLSEPELGKSAGSDERQRLAPELHDSA
jgi:signal transduction histidine kinase